MQISSSFSCLIVLLVLIVGVRAQDPAKPVSDKTENLYKGSEVTAKAHVKKKPDPRYTKDARKHAVEGTVILRCVFSSTGEVKNIHVVSGLPDGLTESAVEAAKKIKFTPAMKDGHPVSMWMELQYNFHLY
ncbi:MAG TPA: energy transducer TonB [Pyrinomonadaceae bacterium]|nr:energy transducer TonB [Pyrinomonadaceae bacterium]